MPTPRIAFLGFLAAAVAILGTALAFQYLGGLAPCVLCIWQRYPYAVIVGLAGVGAGLAGVSGMRPGVLAALAALIALAAFADAGIAAFHVGVEQHWWEGTRGCTGAPAASTLEGLRSELMNRAPVRCDEVAWSFAGISMAGYNAMAAMVLGIAAAAFTRRLWKSQGGPDDG